MKLPPHVMILASAGSGKTYALTSRFIALLAAGAAPERIVALTFTRKAAGEFFDGILRKLASAACDEKEAATLAGELGRPTLRTADFLRMLRQMADALHQLRLGTLDSFFARIARTFPFELGLAGDFEVLQAHGARLERRRVLQRLFAREGELADAQRDFLEAFKRATFGTEEKQLGLRLDEYLDEHYEKFLEVPDGELWGNPARIWPDGQPWCRDLKKERVLTDLRRWIASATMEDKQRERWTFFAAELEVWQPGAPLPKAMAYVLPKLMDDCATPASGAVELTIERKKQSIDAVGCAILHEVLCLVGWGELQRRIEATRGIHAVLQSYDALYDALVRRAGKLTFADVERLLLPDGGRVLTREADEGDRLFLDYRLDAEIDHWLLDEFQDTSRGQWSVLRNLIDEVVQDAEGRRTFFCVGDVKQSIFAWRAGDPRLMGEIREHYNHGGDAPIATLPLDQSWRSGPAIIEMVNAVFGARATLAELFPGKATDEWNRHWRTHTTALPQRTGQAALLHAEDAEARRRLTLDLLRELRPLERGLTCAVLVRKNNEAAEMADYLRREGGLPAVAESDLRVCGDNPVGAALLALFQAAAHPGDRLAWEHVQMTPLGAALAEERVTTPGALAWRVLSEVHARGFEWTAEHWMKRVEPRLEGGREFTRERLRQFAAAAALFDASGSRDVDEFLAFMARHVVREAESAAVVRVMTIHKSKGLGFDVVVVPELEGNRINEPRGGLAVQTNDAHAPEWVLDLPTSLFARNDDVLRKWLERAEQDAAYESFSLLYVAMTRAKRAMFVITEPVGDSESKNFPKLLASTLGDEVQPIRVGALTAAGPWSAGDPDWHRALAAPEPAKAPAPLPTIAATAVPRRVARRPSGERAGEWDAAPLFALGQREAVTFGAEVHALLAEIEWCVPEEIDARALAWQARGVAPAVISEVVGCLRAPTLAALWRAGSDVGGGGVDVWRERAFEVVLGEAWVTGVFDRVIVERDVRGRAVAATVFDFKTEPLSGTARDVDRALARHTAQLQLYRRVVARLTGLAEREVGAEVVFTALAARFPLPDES
jgi:ATP-dependent helicase/nuclease subunit A